MKAEGDDRAADASDPCGGDGAGPVRARTARVPPIVAECHRLADTRVDPCDSEAMEKYKQDFLSACEQAIASILTAPTRSSRSDVRTVRRDG